MFKINLQRIYIFLFFNAGYGFLSFWISVTYFYRIRAFFIGGAISYLFVLLFHRAIIKIMDKNKIDQKLPPNFKVSLFYAGLILFCALYILGVYIMQRLMIDYLNFPEGIFKEINWVLNITSLLLSSLLSFLDTKAGKNIH